MINNKVFEFFNYLGVAVFGVDAQSHKILFMNREAECVTGYNKEQLIGKFFKDIFTFGSQLHIESLLELPTKAPAKEKNLKIHRQAGRTLDVSVSVMKSEDGKLQIITLQDDTLVKRAEWEIADMRSTLVHNAKLAAIGEISSGVAHEVNNPLAVITGICEKVLRQDPDPSIKSELKKILKTSERVAQIVRGLKVLSRDDTSEPLKATCLKKLVDDSLWLLHEKIRLNQIHFQVLDHTNGASVMCHPYMLSQGILNLLGNSCDAILDLKDRWIKVVINKTRNGQIVISITDSGTGISKEIIDRIFNPFFTTKAVGKGTGLGLSLTKSVLEKCSGKIRYNKGAKNTTFDIFLKEAQSGELSIEKEESLEEQLDHISVDQNEFMERKILLIEDEPALAELVSSRLEDYGANVHIIHEFNEAIEFIDDPQNTFDLVISDLIIINGSGADVISHLHNVRPMVRSIIITGSISPDKEDFYTLGVTAVLEKPFNLNQLVKTVSETFVPIAKKWARSKPRVEYKNGVQLNFSGKDYFLTLNNIGTGGMFIEQNTPTFVVGDEVQFKVPLEVSDGVIFMLEGHAIVRWIRFEQSSEGHPPGLGLEFTYLKEQSRQQIIQLISRLKAARFIPKSA